MKDPPRIGNSFLEDAALQSLYRRLVTEDVRKRAEADLVNFGS